MDYRSSRSSLFSDLTNNSFDLGDEAIEFRNSARSSTIYSKEGLAEATLEDFNIVRVLGIGAFGKVFLVQNKDTEEIYAMKSIRKDQIIEYNSLESTKLEKFILSTSNHPFIVKMQYCFSNDVRVYFLMEYIRGGELFKHIQQR